ncbi:hypothetical protein [Candidatus Phytoplasma ziziphi]|uniref:hypothetical protein n=1 Tax=Candidatus Phytoplasma TaxID=33926 RepID=UPI0013753862|nr:hypothetical protein [Candidatus Phytoplasma ziziphi]
MKNNNQKQKKYFYVDFEVTTGQYLTLRIPKDGDGNQNGSNNDRANKKTNIKK